MTTTESNNLSTTAANRNSSTNLNTIGLRLSKLRNDAGMTQENLAFDFIDSNHHVSVGGTDISKYEHDINLPKVEVLVEYCKKFSVSADYILFGKPEVAPMPHLTATMEESILNLADEIRACRGGK